MRTHRRFALPHLNWVFPLFFRERTTFLFGFWDHWLQHAAHLYLSEANEAAGDEFTGTGEFLPQSSARRTAGFCPCGGAEGAAGAFWGIFGGCFWICPVFPGGSGFDEVQQVLLHGSGEGSLPWSFWLWKSKQWHQSCQRRGAEVYLVHLLFVAICLIFRLTVLPKSCLKNKYSA